MSTHYRVRRAVKRALLVGAGAAVLAAPATDAAEAEQEVITEVVVTGSRIARPELTAPSPVISLGQDALQAQGFENIADLANSLPQFNPSFGSSRTQSTFSGSASSGLNLLNLRNLGGVRSLVLVNGRRVPGGTSTSTSADMNMLPTANIERIE